MTDAQVEAEPADGNQYMFAARVRTNAEDQMGRLTPWLVHRVEKCVAWAQQARTFWSHEHAKHGPNAGTIPTKSYINARALTTFAKGQLRVLQMAVSATGAAGPGSPDERRARQVVLRRGQCHAAMPLRLRVARSPNRCRVW